MPIDRMEIVSGERYHVPLSPSNNEMAYERDAIRRIREAVAGGKLGKEFRAEDVNRALGIEFAGTFLPKHRVGNPGGNTELFVRISAGLYRLK
jgi:hypothetical protein